MRKLEILMKIASIFGFVLNFILIPCAFTLELIDRNDEPMKILMMAGLMSLFLGSFFNIFKLHHQYKLLPQVMKMIVAIYCAIIAFASIYKFEGIVAPDGLTSHDVMDSIYFSIVTWTTLGYGDFRPTEGARLWAAFQAILGTLFIPMFLAAVFFSLEMSGSLSSKKHNKTL